MHLKSKIKNSDVKNAVEFITKNAQAEDFLKQTGKKIHGFAKTVFLELRQLMDQTFNMKTAFQLQDQVQEKLYMTKD